MAFVKTEVQGAVEIITIDRPKAVSYTHLTLPTT